MIESIRAQNIGIIKEVEIDLLEGLNVVTGETGAGKTLFTQAILAGMGILPGGEVIGSHSDSSFVEIQLRLPGNIYEELSLDDGEITIRREFSLTGKTRSFFCGRLVPASFLKETGSKMIAVHSQNSQLDLLRKSVQLRILDGFDEELQKAAKRYENIWKNVNDLLIEIQELKENLKTIEREKEILEYQVKEIESARLFSGEDEKLNQLREKLKHFQRISEALFSAATLLKEGEVSSVELLGQAEKALGDIAPLDTEFLNLKESILKVLIDTEEIYREVRGHLDGMIEEEVSIDEVESRLSIIDSLKRKYGESIEEIIRYSENIKKKLDKSLDLDIRIKELEIEIQERSEELVEAGKHLSGLRESMAQKLKKLMREKLTGLMMPYLEFEVYFKKLSDNDDVEELIGVDFSTVKKGFEEIEFVIKNPGTEYKPIAEVASGGELSRILLSLETILGEKNTIPVFIFDEVDAGIGGNTGIVLGKYLKQLSRHSQVICVTHLPQVAAYGDHHILVERRDDSKVSEAKVRLLSYEERVKELARMLSGEVARSKAVEHAEALLESVER